MKASNLRKGLVWGSLLLVLLAAISLIALAAVLIGTPGDDDLG